MKMLITGADAGLACRAARHLGARHVLRLTGRSPRPMPAVAEWEYLEADLRSEEAAREAVAGMDAVLHLAAFDPVPWQGDDAEQQALEYATLGTYVLCQEARRAGVERIVVAGSLRIFDAYADNYLIDEMWKPRPAPDAEGLRPYLCERVVREFAREGGINGVCLRFLPIGEDPERNTSPADALHAVDRALAMEFAVVGYRWQVFHIATSSRFVMRSARRELSFQSEGTS